MLTTEVINYLKTQLLQGHSEDEIRNNLVSRGWTPEDINEAFLRTKLPESIPSSDNPSPITQSSVTTTTVSKNRSSLTDNIKFVALIAAIIVFFLTVYAGLSPVWFLVLFAVPILIFLIFNSIRSFINKEYRTYISHTTHTSILKGVDAQIAASIIGLCSIFVLVCILYYVLLPKNFILTLQKILMSNYFYIALGLFILLMLFYGLLVIFKDRNK